MAYYEIRLPEGRTILVDGDRIERVPVDRPDEDRASSSTGDNPYYLTVWKKDRLVAWHKNACIEGEDDDQAMLPSGAAS